MKLCQVDGCDRRVAGQGLCKKHHKSYMKKGLIHKLTYEAQECSVEGCTMVANVRGMCNLHYRRHMKFGDVHRTDPRLCVHKCSHADCDRKASKGGHCPKHQGQIRKYGATMITTYDKRHAIIEGDIAKIPIGLNAKDGYAIVDADMSWVDEYHWCLDACGYARTHKKIAGEKFLHHLIVGRKDGMEVDHKDRNPLNNTRDNLRHVTHIDNMQNTKRSKVINLNPK